MKLSPIDVPHKDKPLFAADYATTILQHRFSLIERYSFDDYMSESITLTSDIRAQEIAWTVQSLHRFDCKNPYTLHLAVSTFDRYCAAARNLKPKEITRAMVASTLLACKYEEIHPPAAWELAGASPLIFDRLAVVDAETAILRALDYELFAPTSIMFLERFVVVLNVGEQRVVDAARMYADFCLFDFDVMQQFNPSLIAATVLTLATNHPTLTIKGCNEGISQLLLDYAGLGAAQLVAAAAVVAEALAKWMEESTHIVCKYVEHIFDDKNVPFADVPPSIDNLVQSGRRRYSG